MKNYQRISQALLAIQNCKASGNAEWLDKDKDALAGLISRMPHGSGIDGKVDLMDDSPNRLVFSSDFHHMDENGFYDGWTEHLVIVTPSLAFGFQVRITGKNKSGIKEYLHSLWYDALDREYVIERTM